MKKLFSILAVLILVCSLAGPAWAGGCGARTKGGDCFNPGFNDTGSIGTSTHEWGEMYVDDITVSGDPSFPSGSITATDIANVSRELPMPGMAGWVVDNTGPITVSTAPNLFTADNVPAILWDNSTEVVPIQYTFRLPQIYVNNLTFYALISSNIDGASAVKMDWRMWENGNGIVFDNTPYEQTLVSAGAAGALSTTCEVLTFTPDATLAAALTAGRYYTLELFNATTHLTANLELKGVAGVFTGTQ